MTRRYFVLLTGLAMGLVVGCFDASTTNCATGTEGCACTVGGSCDGDLVCASEICVALGGTDTSGDGDPGDGDPGDGDPGDGDGDGDPGDGDGDGDQCGNIGDSCDVNGCCVGLSCDGFGICSPESGDGDGDGDGDPSDCPDDDPWCPTSMACTTDQALSSGDLPDYWWCWHICDPVSMDISTCPPAPMGTQLQCADVGLENDGGCVVVCPLGSDVCPPGSECLDIGGGVGACMYPLNP